MTEPISPASYRILGGVGFGIDRHARSKKGRGLFRKGPDAREIGDRVGRLIRRVVKEGVERAGWKQDRYLVELRLHPGAPLATLTVEPDAELVVRGDAASLGPGYFCEVVARLAPLLDELEYAWTEPTELAAAQSAMCAWLATELRGGSAVQFGIPETRRFRIASPGVAGAERRYIEPPVLTPLGPRDAAWRDAVIADPAHARDAFPWWDRGPGRAERARALIAMWLEVPWREPLDSAERELMEKVDADLRAARKADPALDLPWAAWRELLEHLGVDDEEVSAKADAEVSTVGTNVRPSAQMGTVPISSVGVAQMGTVPISSVGYRRHDIEVELSGGWRVTIPGAMVGHWEDDGARYWATDAERAIDFSSLTAEGEEDSDRLLAVAPEKHAVIARHSDGAYRGRAEAFDDGDVHVVIGLMTIAPHVGILTCKGGDDGWALALWRSLRHEAG